MTKRYSIAEARNNLPALVHDAEAGTPIELTRRGKRVAMLISASDYERLAKGGPSFWSALQAFRKEHDLSELDVDSIFEDVRDRSPGRGVKW